MRACSTRSWSTGPAATFSAGPSEASMEIIFAANGQGRCVYDEAIDLTTLGKLAIQRGSHVEPDEAGTMVGRPCTRVRSLPRPL